MRYQMKHRLSYTAAFMILVPWMNRTSDPPPSLGESEAEFPGAIDPTLPGNLGPATNQVLPKTSTDAAIGANKLVNDRTLCPDGRGLIQSETTIAVSGNVLVAAFNDSRGVCEPSVHAAIGWAFSLDNGETWTDGGGLPNNPSLNNGDPWLSVSPDGSTFYLTGLWNFYQGFGFMRGTLVTDTIVWDTPTVISFPPSATHDKEATAVDPVTGRIYLTYTRFGSPGSGIWSTHSDDGGFNWSPEVAVFLGGAQGSFPVVNQRGDLMVAFCDTVASCFQVGGTVKAARSVDGGDSFQEVASFPYTTAGVTFMDRASAFPQIAVDRSGGARDGWLYMVWHSGSGGYLRPYISHSEDSGDTWSDPIPVNTDTTVAYHWWPSVSVDGNGTVNVIYLDRRNNPGTGLTDLFLSQSTDGATTFTDVQVTDVTSSWQGIRSDPGFTYSGDYIRGVTSGTSLYATWPDPRNGDPDVYFSRIDVAALAAKN